MKMNELLEGRHPHDQYYRAKPKSQFKWKPRPKKTLWYTKDMFDNWAADIRTRFSDATAYYDEESEEVIASSADMKKAYGRWRKNDKEGRHGVSYYKPRPIDTVTHRRKTLRMATEGFDMILKDLLENMYDEEDAEVEELPDDLVAQYKERANAEREGGGNIDINEMLPTIAITMSDGSEYFFQGEEADDMISQTPPNIYPEDFILAMAQNW